MIQDISCITCNVIKCVAHIYTSTRHFFYFYLFDPVDEFINYIYIYIELSQSIVLQGTNLSNFSPWIVTRIYYLACKLKKLFI